MSFDTGLEILKKNTLGFSHLEDFNDPFECTGLGLYDLEVPLCTAISAFRNRFSRNYIILSLTRTALNPLMWSHYADSYKGVVIGIDVKKAGFEDGNKFIIPSTKGEIRYLKTAPEKINKGTIERLMSVGNSNILNWENEESLLKHALLYKMQEWAYEEEVRVVKNISSAKFPYHDSPKKEAMIDNQLYSTKTEAFIDNQLWKRVQLPTRPIYTLDIPQEAFVEVYIGKNTYIDQRRKYQMSGEKVEDHIIPKFEELRKICSDNNINFYQVDVDIEQWKLKSSLINKVT